MNKVNDFSVVDGEKSVSAVTLFAPFKILFCIYCSCLSVCGALSVEVRSGPLPVFCLAPILTH